MIDYLPNIVNWIFDQLTEIFNLYTTSSVLAGFFVLWMLDKMFGIFDVLKR